MSDLPPSNGPLVDLRTTYGAILIGVFFSAGFMGITVSQAWQYYNNFPKDPLYLKAVVAYIVIVELLRLAFSINGEYYYLVLEWGNPLALANLVWSSQITLLLSALVEVVVRLYFAYRVFIMSRHNWYITPVIVLLALANMAVGGATWAISLKDTVVTDHTALLHSFGTAGLSLGLVTDWSISLSLIYFLLKSRTGMSQTNSIINYIVFYTINMGLITSMTDVVVLGLSLWNSAKPQLYFLALFQVLGNLYAISLLASLNSRMSIRESSTAPLSDFSTFAAGSRPQDIDDSTLGGSQRINRTQDVSFSQDNSSAATKEKRYPSTGYADV